MGDVLHTVLTLAAAAPAAEDVVEYAGPAPGAVHWTLLLVAEVGLVAIMIAMLMCLYRIVRGPRLADRVLAADLFGWQVVGLVILLTIYLGNLVYFDLILGVAIVGFASTVAFAQLIGGQAARRERCDGTAEVTGPAPAPPEQA